jgi:hypothetical protein
MCLTVSSKVVIIWEMWCHRCIKKVFYNSEVHALTHCTMFKHKCAVVGEIGAYFLYNVCSPTAQI